MAKLVNTLNLPGVQVKPDPASLANLDVDHLIEQAHTQYSEKPRTELTNLRQWVKKLLILLARTKDLNVEDAELDSYFVEWVKRQEAKRKTDA
jgi:predicted NUDIX family NTP pyrophosphohydrolase